MKILLNACFGGFGLDETLAKDFCDRVCLATKPAFDLQGQLIPEHRCLVSTGTWLCYAFNSSRTSPALIALVEEYLAAGKPVSCEYADIKVIETDDSRLWYIAEELGKETIVYLDENKETK